MSPDGGAGWISPPDELSKPLWLSTVVIIMLAYRNYHCHDRNFLLKVFVTIVILELLEAVENLQNINSRYHLTAAQ